MNALDRRLAALDNSLLDEDPCEVVRKEIEKLHDTLSETASSAISMSRGESLAKAQADFDVDVEALKKRWEQNASMISDKINRDGALARRRLNERLADQCSEMVQSESKCEKNNYHCIIF